MMNESETPILVIQVFAAEISASRRRPLRSSS